MLLKTIYIFIENLSNRVLTPGGGGGCRNLFLFMKFWLHGCTSDDRGSRRKEESWEPSSGNESNLRLTKSIYFAKLLSNANVAICCSCQDLSFRRRREKSSTELRRTITVKVKHFFRLSFLWLIFFNFRSPGGALKNETWTCNFSHKILILIFFKGKRFFCCRSKT